MKKVYFIIGGILVSALTITAVNAETTSTPTNPNNTLENKVQVIDQMVKDGELDTKTAEEIKIQLENCDGTGSKKLGQEYNLRFGQRLGNGMGNGQGKRIQPE